jgi:hypothetical protein
MDIFNKRIRGKNEPFIGLVPSNGRVIADADRIGGLFFIIQKRLKSFKELIFLGWVFRFFQGSSLVKMYAEMDCEMR